MALQGVSFQENVVGGIFYFYVLLERKDIDYSIVGNNFAK